MKLWDIILIVGMVLALIGYLLVLCLSIAAPFVYIVLSLGGAIRPEQVGDGLIILIITTFWIGWLVKNVMDD